MSTESAFPAPRRLITADDLSAKLSVRKSTLYLLASTGKIPGLVRIAQRIRFDEAVIDAWIASGGSPNKKPEGLEE